jgi:replicative DNA helicase
LAIIHDLCRYTPAARLIDIQAKARKLKAANEQLCLVIVDYLTMVTLGGRSRSENRQQEVAEISRGLKAMARELNVPVIVLSQLSRGVESRKEDKRPLLSDLRESGGIEQDADIVMFIYRDDYYKREESIKNEVSPTELIISKHRNGPTGMVNLMFLKKYGEFNSAAYEETKRSGS